MVQIFISDSFDAGLDMKIRKKSKIKEVEAELQLYDIKITEITQQYRLLAEKEKDILEKIRQTNKELARSKEETLLKVRLHLGTYWKNLLEELENCARFEQHTCQCYQDYIF